MSSHAYHAQLVKLPLSLGELVKSNELKQRRVHGLLHLAKTLDVDRVFEVLPVPAPDAFDKSGAATDFGLSHERAGTRRRLPNREVSGDLIEQSFAAVQEMSL